MPARSALVVATGVAGLATAFRLRRSCWDVVLLDHAESTRDHLGDLRGPSRAAARRLGLLPALHEEDLAAVLRAALGDVTIRRDVRVDLLVPGDCGVTVTFSDGDEEWFDLVVTGTGGSPVDGVVVQVDDTHDLYAAELLGDAFDIFRDAEEAVRWWRKSWRPARSDTTVPPTRTAAHR